MSRIDALLIPVGYIGRTEPDVDVMARVREIVSSTTVGWDRPIKLGELFYTIKFVPKKVPGEVRRGKMNLVARHPGSCFYHPSGTRGVATSDSRYDVLDVEIEGLPEIQCLQLKEGVKPMHGEIDRGNRPQVKDVATPVNALLSPGTVSKMFEPLSKPAAGVVGTPKSAEADHGENETEDEEANDNFEIE